MQSKKNVLPVSIESTDLPYVFVWRSEIMLQLSTAVHIGSTFELHDVLMAAKCIHHLYLGNAFLMTKAPHASSMTMEV